MNLYAVTSECMRKILTTFVVSEYQSMGSKSSSSWFRYSESNRSYTRTISIHMLPPKSGDPVVTSSRSIMQPSSGISRQMKLHGNCTTST
jgi:hypothetical protein